MAQTTRPRILLISPVVPYPPRERSRAAILGLLKALKDEFDVTILVCVGSENERRCAGALEEWCSRVVAVMAPERRSGFHRVYYRIFYQLKSMILRRSLGRTYYCPGTLVRAARRMSRLEFDLVVVAYWQLSELASVMRKSKSLLITFDIDLLVNRQVSLLERNLVKKIQAIRKWLAEQKEELAAYRNAGHVWTLTERDRDAVKTICRNNDAAEVMPFGLDIDFYAPSGMNRNQGEVLFLGDLRAALNRDALEYFAQKIYPHIDDVEGLSITIVGGHLPKELQYFALFPEVEVVADVSDVRPYLHRASCLILPLRFGGGLRLRVLEAMAAGLPVVCSDVAVMAMPFKSGEELLRADKPEDYAAAIRRLLSDGDVADRIATAAGRRVRELFALKSQETRLVDMVRRLIDGN